MNMETLKLTYQEYWGYYWRVVSRHKIPGIFKWDEDLVNLIEKHCQLPKGASILDLGCAGGDQAKLFSRRGFTVVGIDTVKSLINSGDANMGVRPSKTWNKTPRGGSFAIGARAPYIRGR
jgi:2-polyprenyl-3-methyl-5-hydroxy-6-metoxy-1,4-benzoquinol methylase